MNITAIVGYHDAKPIGNGKTLLMTYLAHLDHLQGRKIIANYSLFFKEPQVSLEDATSMNIHPRDIPVLKMTLEDVAKLPRWLMNATVCIDEIHVGADAREIFKAGNKALTTLISQLRKRNITLYYTTQHFKKSDKRLREQTDQVIMIKRINPPMFYLEIFDRYSNTRIGERYFNGSGVYDLYDTDEVIHYDHYDVLD